MTIHQRAVAAVAILALFSTWPAAAQQPAASAPVFVEKPVPSTRPYDGSGSTSQRGGSDVRFDPAVYEKGRAASDAKRKALADDVATTHRLAATVELAALIEQGDYYHAPDRAAALDLYEKAADLGNMVGLQKMCIAYLLGEGRPVNVDKGLDYGAALRKGDPVRLFSAGFDYETGASGPKDLDRARAAYMEAGKQGSGEAMDALGRLSLADGKPEVARHLFREGTYLGSADAIDHLATMVEKGEGGAEDSAEAYWLYVQAGRHGNAHAAAWVAALPTDTEPLGRTLLMKDKAFTHITRTWTDGGSEKTKTYTLVSLLNTLRDRLPTLAIEGRQGGTATLHCYVGGDDVIDACVLMAEDPPGYDFGALVEWLFDGHLVVDAVDVGGQPSAHTVLAFTINYEIQGGHPRP